MTHVQGRVSARLPRRAQPADHVPRSRSGEPPASGFVIVMMDEYVVDGAPPSEAPLQLPRLRDAGDRRPARYSRGERLAAGPRRARSLRRRIDGRRRDRPVPAWLRCVGRARRLPATGLAHSMAAPRSFGWPRRTRRDNLATFPAFASAERCPRVRGFSRTRDDRCREKRSPRTARRGQTRSRREGARARRIRPALAGERRTCQQRCRDLARSEPQRA